MFLLLFTLFLGRLEAWMLMPDERAAAVSQLLEQVDEAEELAAWESHWLGAPPNPPKPGPIQV